VLTCPERRVASENFNEETSRPIFANVRVSPDIACRVCSFQFARHADILFVWVFCVVRATSLTCSRVHAPGRFKPPDKRTHPPLRHPNTFSSEVHFRFGSRGRGTGNDDNNNAACTTDFVIELRVPLWCSVNDCVFSIRFRRHDLTTSRVVVNVRKNFVPPPRVKLFFVF